MVVAVGQAGAAGVDDLGAQVVNIEGLVKFWTARPFSGRAEINLAKNETFTKWVQNRPFDVKLCPGEAKSRARPPQIDQFFH